MEQKLKQAMGEQMFAIMALQTQLEQRDAEIKALKMRLEVQDAAKVEADPVVCSG